jgi:nitrogen fixation NifU-like protein
MTSPEFNFAELDELYQEIVLDHYRNPHNARRLESPTITAEGNNPFCGDESAIQVALNEEGRVAQVGVQGRGCSISQASGSLMSDLLKGKTLEEVEELADLFRGMMQGKPPSQESLERLQDTGALQGVRMFPIRIKCALLAWMTLLEGIEGYQAQARR